MIRIAVVSHHQILILLLKLEVLLKGLFLFEVNQCKIIL